MSSPVPVLAHPRPRPAPLVHAAPVHSPPSATSPAAWKQQPSTAAVVFGLRLPYRPPRSPLGAFLWRRRLWIETTFALSMIQPWEKVLVLLITYAALLFLVLGMYAYFPTHLAYLRARAAYYLLGAEPAAWRSAPATAWGAVVDVVREWNASAGGLGTRAL